MGRFDEVFVWVLIILLVGFVALIPVMIVRDIEWNNYISSEEGCSEYGVVRELETKLHDGTCYVYYSPAEGFITVKQFDDLMDGADDTYIPIIIPIR